jgi:hypothetical protein
MSEDDVPATPWALRGNNKVLPQQIEMHLTTKSRTFFFAFTRHNANKDFFFCSRSFQSLTTSYWFVLAMISLFFFVKSIRYTTHKESRILLVYAHNRNSLSFVITSSILRRTRMDIYYILWVLQQLVYEQKC